MANLNEVSLEQIIKNAKIVLVERDIFYYCKDDDALAKLGALLRNKATMSHEEMRAVERFLIENESKIDKERFLLFLLYNYVKYYEQVDLSQLKEVLGVIEKITGIEDEELTDNQIEQIMHQVDKCNQRKQLLDTIINAFCKQTGRKPWQFKEGMSKFLSEIVHGSTASVIDKIFNYKETLRDLEKSFNQVSKYLQGQNTIVPIYFYDEKEDKYKLKILSAQQFLTDGKFGEYNRKRVEDLTTYYGEGLDGVAFAVQTIILNDLEVVFSNEDLGRTLRMMIIENVAISRGMTREEIDRLKVEDLKTYDKKVDGIEWGLDFVNETAEAIREYAEYVDLDKLLLIAAFRLNKHLEERNINLANAREIKISMQGLYDNIRDKKGMISCDLNFPFKNVVENFIHVEYSAEDLKKCLKKFTSKGYVSERQKEDYRLKIESQEIDFTQMDDEEIDIIFSIEEQERYSLLSDNNLLFIARRNNWTPEKILDCIIQKNGCSIETLIELLNSKEIGKDEIKQLYLQGIVEIEIFDNIDKIKELVDPSEFITLYKKTVAKDVTDEERQKNKEEFYRYCNLYKKIMPEEEQDRNEQEEQLISSIFEKIENEEELINALEESYMNGLIGIERIIDWYGQDIIEIFYNKAIITLDDIKKFVLNGIIPVEYMSEKYATLIKNTKDYDERLVYIRSGLVDEKDIIDLFKNTLLFPEDLLKLAEEGFVTQKEADRAINNRSLEELEKHSAIRLRRADDLKKITPDNNSGGNGGITVSTKAKEIIHPDVRNDFIKMFNAFRVETGDLDEDNPFYNYEFYAIPDETGSLGVNSVIIAERYFEDKDAPDSKKRDAVGNATYFFRYCDLAVLSNLSKSEMDKERENIVFRSNHTIASDKKVGGWATSVIFSVVKTMLSSSLKNHTKEEQRRIVIDKLVDVLGQERLLDLLDMATQIDHGEYNCEPLGGGIYKLPDNSGFEFDD